MIDRTRRKLDEARFFYQLLVNERPQTMKAFGHDPRAFRYYFSAFIQAARSVTWTLGNEEPGTWNGSRRGETGGVPRKRGYWTSRTNSALMRLSAAEQTRWWNGKK